MSTYMSIAETSDNRILLLSSDLAAIDAIEHQQAALAEQRDLLLAQLLSDLDWMDIPVHRLYGISVGDLPKSISIGTRVHLVRQYEEAGPYDMLMAHPAGACDWFCRGSEGETVKAGGPTRWRFRCEGEFEYLGIAQGQNGIEYLFSAVLR